MLEKYKQKSEERKELSLQGDKQQPKPMERRSLTRDSSNDSTSVCKVFLIIEELSTAIAHSSIKIKCAKSTSSPRPFVTFWTEI